MKATQKLHDLGRAPLLTSNRPIDDWGKLLGDTAAVTGRASRIIGDHAGSGRPGVRRADLEGSNLLDIRRRPAAP